MINENLNKCLENEFAKLGFDYSEIEANGTRTIDSRKLEMYLVDYTGMPEMLADGVAILFTINTEGEQRKIEKMSATLFNDSCYGKFTPLTERFYCVEDKHQLPNKTQIHRELTDLYKSSAKIGKKLYPELTQLGFDVSAISGLKTLTMESLRHGEIILTDLYSDNDDIGYIFTLRRNTGTDDWNLHTIRANVQLDSVRKIEGVIVVGKEYSCISEPLPTKSQIRSEILEMVRIEKIKEKFAVAEHNRTPCKRKNL